MTREDIDVVLLDFEGMGYSWVEHIHSATGVVTAAFNNPCELKFQNRAKNKSLFRRQLETLGVLGKKRIPEAYLRSSVPQRLELLAGIMDTDGNVDKNGRCRIVCGERALVGDIFDLCSSLGFKPYIIEAEPSISSSGIRGRKKIYTIGFQPRIKIPCRLRRKQRMRLDAEERMISITSVERVEKGRRGKCIQIDHPDGTYLVGKKLIPTHNSRLVAEEFPAWVLGRNPKAEIICSSYAAERSNKISLNVRARIEENAMHQLIFPDCKVSQYSRKIENWLTTQNGQFLSAGVGGPITGMGADCVTGDSLVEVFGEGAVEIKNLWLNPRPVKVLSMLPDGSIGFCNVEALRRIQKKGILRITTSGGRVLECTPDHRIFSSGRYVKADSLSPGDRLLCSVRESVCEEGFRNAKVEAEGAHSPLLLEEVFVRASLIQESQEVHKMRRACREKDSEVLREVPTEETREKGDLSTENEGMPDLQFEVQSEVERQEGSEIRGLLQQEMCGNRAFQGNAWEGKSEVEARSNPSSNSTAFSESFPGYASLDLGEGWTEVCCLPIDKGSSRSPHRRRSDEQRCFEPRHALREVSQEMACCEGFSRANDTVALVERVCEETDVYDLQVEESETFFANEILVHNCLIIDDPTKNREEAESKATRDKIWDWYTSTAYTRLSPQGVVVIVMTRWHPDDLVGRLMDPDYQSDLAAAGVNEEKFRIINLPAIAESDDDPLGRKAGEALWPERWDEQRLKATKHTVGSYDWNSLYQNCPVMKGGNYIQREWFKVRPRNSIPSGMRWVRAWDIASTEKAKNDPFCGVKGAMFEGILYLDGMMTGRMKWPDQRRKILTTAIIEGILVGVGAQGQEVGLADDLKEASKGKAVIKSYSQVKDKLTRALSWIALAEAEKVVLIEGEWIWDFLDEAEAFPTGKHDDRIDAVSLVHQMLTETAMPLLA